MNKTDFKSSRLRKVLVDSLIVLGMSLFLILIIEGVLRLFFSQNLTGTQIEGRSFSEADELLGLRYSPGSRWRFRHPEYDVEYWVNEHGFRDRKEHPIPKPQGTGRVLLLGDSFTFGQGLDYNQTWPVLIENYLEETGKPHIDLMKAGIQGLDTRSEFIMTRRLLDKYECDFVVVGFLVNDLYTNSLYGIEESAVTAAANGSEGKKHTAADSWVKSMTKVFVRNDRRSSFHTLIFAKRLAIANDAAYCQLYQDSSGGAYFHVPLQKGPARQLKITERLFKELSDFCKARGKKLIVLSIPQQYQVLYFDKSQKIQNIDVEYYDRHFAEMARKEGFSWVTTLEDFVNVENNSKLFYRLDGHLSRAGSELLAEIFMQKVIPLFDGAGSTSN